MQIALWEKDDLAVWVGLNVDAVHLDYTISRQQTSTFRRRVMFYVADELFRRSAGVHGEAIAAAATTQPQVAQA